MKYLIYDADASRRILGEMLREIGPDLTNAMRNASLEASDGFEDRELTDLPPIVVTACVDQDGVKYESLELIATMRFVQDEVTYLSNGYFAINLAEAIDGQKDLLNEILPTND